MPRRHCSSVPKYKDVKNNPKEIAQAFSKQLLFSCRKTLSCIVVGYILIVTLYGAPAQAQTYEECAVLYSDNGAIPGDPQCKFLASTVSVGLGNFGCRTFSGPRYVDQFCGATPINPDWLDLTILTNRKRTVTARLESGCPDSANGR